MAKAGQIVINMTANTRQLTSGLQKAQSEMKKTDMTTRMMGISIQRVGASVANGARKIGTAFSVMSAGVAGAGLVAVKTASDWESSFTEVSKVLDPATTDVAGLEKELLNMAKTTPLTTKELAEVASSAGRLGIEGKDKILKFTEVMSAMGVATNLSAEEAGDSMARFANITKMPIDEVDRLGSTIVNLGNNLPTTEREILRMGTRMASAGHTAGLTEAEIMGMAGALSATGVSAERGGTNMSKFFRTVDTGVKDGGDALNTLAEVSGMTAEEFRQKFEEDASGAIVAFLGGLNKMDEEGKSTSGVLDDLGLNGAIMNEVLGNLSGNLELVEGALGYANTGWDENSALMKEAEQRYSTFKSLIQLVKNNLEVLAIVIGGEIMNVLSGMIKALLPLFEHLHNVAEAFTELSEPVKKAIVYVGMGVSAFLGFIAVMAFVVAGIASVISMFGLFLAGASAVGLTLSGLIVIVTSVVAVIGLIGGAIISSVATFGVMIASSQKFRDSVLNVFKGISNRVKIVLDEIKIFASNIWEKIVNFWESDIKGFISKLEGIFQPILDKIDEFGGAKGIVDFGIKVADVRNKVENAFDKVLDVIGNVLDFVGKAMENIAVVIEGLMPVIGRLKDTFIDLFKGVKPTWENLKQLFSSLMPIIEVLAVVVGGVLVGAFGVVVGVVNGVVSALMPFINAIISATDFIVNMVNVVVALFKGDFAGAWEFLTDAGQSALDFFASAFMTIYNLVEGFVMGIVDFFAGLYNTLVGNSIIPDMVEGILEWILKLKDRFIEFVMGLVENVIDWFINLKDSVVEYVMGMVEGVVEAFSNIYESVQEKMELVKSIIDLVWSFIKVTFQTAMDIIKAVLDGDFSKVIEIVQNYMEKTKVFLQMIWDRIKVLIGDKASEILENIKDRFIAIKDNIVEKTESAREGAVNKFNSMKDAVKQKVLDIFNNVKQKFIDIKNSIRDRLEDAKNALVNKFTTMVSNAKAKVIEIWNNVKQKFNDIKSTITNLLEQAKNALVNKFTTMVSNAKAKVLEIWNNVKQKFSDIKSTITNLLEQAKTALVNKFTTMVSNARTKLTKIWTTVKQKFEDVKSAIKSKMTDAVRTVGKKIGEMPGKVRDGISKMKSAGIDLIKGLINGINNKAKGAVNAVKNLGKSMIKNVKGIFKSKSPSKVFIGIGGDTGDGLIIGMDKSRRSVAKASKRMAESAVIDPKDLRTTIPSPRDMRNRVSTAVKGSVEIDTREDAIVTSINELRNDMTNLRVDMDGREVGRITESFVSEKQDYKERSRKRFGG